MEYTEFRTGQRVRCTSTGVEGRIVQLFHPTGRPVPSFKVKTDDGREYCAPVNEWEPCDEPIRQPDILVRVEHVYPNPRKRITDFPQSITITVNGAPTEDPEALARHLAELLEKSFGGEAHGSR